MNTRTPQRLVGVDVPHSGQGTLVEQRSLDRRAAPGEQLAQSTSRELARERLPAEPRRKVRLELVRLDQQPRAEAADVPVCDVRPVV